MMPGKVGMVTIKGYLIKETEKAVLLRSLEDGYPEEWIPKSQIQGGLVLTDASQPEDREKMKVLIRIPLWLAETKDLPYTTTQDEHEEEAGKKDTEADGREPAPKLFDSYGQDDDIPF